MAYSFKSLPDAPVVNTHFGLVRGKWQTGYSAVYLGIPYAKAPTGRRRFLAPESPEPWHGVRDASQFGPTPQRRPFAPVTTIPESTIPGDDILNLNVFTPAPGDRFAKCPVLVWIHGGGFFAGSAASPWYNGVSFNEHGVVVVTISYRLGFEGFGWIDGAPLNRGLLDQIAALRWVKENISAFGGDPDRITIAGQSAGGGSVLCLAASPLTEGLFQRAISLSGVVHVPAAEDVRPVGEAIAAAFGISPTLAAWSSLDDRGRLVDVEREHNHLSSQRPYRSVEDILEDFAAGRVAANDLALRPVVDGDVLDQDPIRSFASGRKRGVPLMLGSTRNEFSFAADASAPDFDSIVQALRHHGVREDAITQYAAEVEAIGRDRAFPQLMTSQLFRAGNVAVALARMAAGAGDYTWLYDFAQRAPKDGAALHCHDIPYAFRLLTAEGVTEALGDDPPQALADVMHEVFVSFVRGEPPSWPSAAENAAGAMRFACGPRYDAEAYTFEHALLECTGFSKRLAD